MSSKQKQSTQTGQSYQVQTFKHAGGLIFKRIRGYFALVDAMGGDYSSRAVKWKLFVAVAEGGIHILRFAHKVSDNRYTLESVEKRNALEIQPQYELTTSRIFEVAGSCGFAALDVASLTFGGPIAWIRLGNAVVHVSECAIAITCAVADMRGEACYFEHDEVGKKIKLGVQAALVTVNVANMGKSLLTAGRNMGKTGLQIGKTSAFNLAKAGVEMLDLALASSNLLDAYEQNMTGEELTRIANQHLLHQEAKLRPESFDDYSDFGSFQTKLPMCRSEPPELPWSVPPFTPIR